MKPKVSLTVDIQARQQGLTDKQIAAALGLQVWQVEDLLLPMLVSKKPARGKRE